MQAFQVANKRYFLLTTSLSILITSEAHNANGSFLH